MQTKSNLRRVQSQQLKPPLPKRGRLHWEGAAGKTGQRPDRDGRDPLTMERVLVRRLQQKNQNNAYQQICHLQQSKS